MYNREIWKTLKPLLDRFCVDPDFQSDLRQETPDILWDMVSPLDSAQVREAILWFHDGVRDADGNPYLQCLCDHQRDISEMVRERIRHTPYQNEDLARYNSIVWNRAHTECRPIREHGNIFYVPIMFELGHGCSVQCPFCGVDAPPFRENYLYTPEHAALWREVLSISTELIGPAVGLGACYFATEPLDHPDYEKFVGDFRDITGRIPQTTTAIAERNPERVRRFMRQLGSEEMRKAALRFSIRTKPQFEKIMKIYTPEELADIELLPNNWEAETRYSYSGKVRRHPALHEDSPKVLPYSIVCLAGPRVNMADSTMEWVEPERPSDEFPNGYRSCGTAVFRDGVSYRRGLLELIRKYAITEIVPGRNLSVNPHVKLQKDGNTISFLGDGVTMRASGNYIFQEAVQLLSKGASSFDDLCKELKIGGFTAESLRAKLNQLLWKGYIKIV